MGGRGATGHRSGSGVIGNQKSLKVEVLGQQHREGTTLVGRTTWEKNVYEASPVASENGVLNIQYAKMNYEQVSRNKVKGTTNLKAGIVETKRGYEEHNINWNKVTEIRGKTYEIKDLIKKKGFKWNNDKKAWTK